MVAYAGTACVYRTHLLNERVISEFHKFQKNANMDVYLLYGHQEEDKPVPLIEELYGIPKASLVVRKTQDLLALQLPLNVSFRDVQEPDVGRVVWMCADYDFCVFQQKYPAFKYYWFFDWDVYMHGPSYADFFALHENDTADFLGRLLGYRKENWFWRKNVQWWSPNHDAHIASFFPITRIANEALSFICKRRIELYETYKKLDRDNNYWPNCEIFVATELYNNKYSCAELHEKSFDVYQFSPFPLRYIPASYNGKIYHPVKERIVVSKADHEENTDDTENKGSGNNYELLEKMAALLTRCACSGYPGQLKNFSLFQFFSEYERLEQGRELYYRHDEASLRTFDWVIQYRSLKSFYGKQIPFELPHTPYPYLEWKKITEKIKEIDGPAIDSYPLDLISAWVLEAHALHDICTASSGDIVFDCGTFTGNTSLYFSQKVGQTGHVYGFEAHPETFATYQHNVQGKDNITPIGAAVSDCSGAIHRSEHALDSRESSRGVETRSLALDDFVREESLPRVDFIKMDVEGSEGKALDGCAETIRAFTPKMAISAYHKLFDIVELPEKILSIHPYYSFYLRHYSNVEDKTVLFCVPQKTKTKSVVAQSFKNNDLFFLERIFDGFLMVLRRDSARYKKTIASLKNERKKVQ